MDRETRLKRLFFRCNHRGSKESDLILGAYAADCLDAMDDEALARFEAFLDEDDHDIWQWVTGHAEPEPGRYDALIAHLRSRYALAD